MKLLLLISLPLLILENKMENHPDSQRKFFYYCTSKSIQFKELRDKQYVLYSEVKEITCEETFIKTVTSRWAEFVKNNCRNINGCTSDLNYYKTIEDANNSFERTKAYYTDTAKFITSKVNF